MKTMNLLMVKFPFVVILILLTLVQCSQKKVAAPTHSLQANRINDFEEDEYAVKEVSDPLQGFNRCVFTFNDKTYTFLIRPIAKSYAFLLPDPVEKGIENFYDNLRFPVRLINCGLQGKWNRAGLESRKFIVNTIAGVGGIFKLSDRCEDLKDVPAEDFGQTLGFWGAGQGFYVVIPLLGPSSAREIGGRLGDYVMDPSNYLWFSSENAEDVAAALNALDWAQRTPGIIKAYDATVKDVMDPYLAMRDGFLQYRAAQVKR
jgi:phospholipid-binding lipoprotein MlaA